MMAKKILMAVSNYWTSPYQVGSHHYAKFFAKQGWKVLFISDPISPFHFLKKSHQLNDRLNIYKGRIDSKIDNLSIYVPMALFTPNEKPFFRTDFVAENWNKFTLPNIFSYIKKQGFENIDLLWFDSIIQSFLIKRINYKKSILRLADKIESFKKISKGIIKCGNDLKKKVDYIIYSAKSLEDYTKDFSEKSYYLPNGVDVDNFLNVGNLKIPEDLINIKKPVIIYTGALEEWFDLDLLMEVANRNQDFSFVLIGEPSIDMTKIKTLKNVFILGRKNYSLIPSYLNHADVGIIPFNLNHPVVDTVNPLKLYEYMACGLPVVATKWKELTLINSPAFLAKDPAEFSELLKKAVNSGKKKEYIDFAKNNSWAKRFEQLEIIYNN